MTRTLWGPLQPLPEQALAPTGQPPNPGSPPYVHFVAWALADHCTLTPVPTWVVPGTEMAAWKSAGAAPQPAPVRVTPVAANTVEPGTSERPLASVVAVQL
ncbi:MAG: hypothetical protein ABIR62_04785 [Dokdonella sp.]|uniref:hypothetical protein n=1 Tax=Dokdonella sp. TaxID=2291710 RepID=UPI0032637B4A